MNGKLLCVSVCFFSFIYLLKWSKILFATILINKIIFILLTFISIIIIITFTVRFSYMYINMYVDFKFKTGLLLKLRAHIKTCCCIFSNVSLFWWGRGMASYRDTLFITERINVIALNEDRRRRIRIRSGDRSVGRSYISLETTK